MANRVNFSVTCQPIVTLANPTTESVGGDLAQTDMPKALGGSGAMTAGESDPTTTCNFTTTTGYSSGVVAYQNINQNASNVDIVAAGSLGTTMFACIRHTGYEYSSPTALGAATTMAVEIWIGTQGICYLRPGEAIVLPLRGLPTGVALAARLQAGTTGVALEVFCTT